MTQELLPTNGALVQFKRKDEGEWKQGEFDEENKLFIEIYSAEIVTHHVDDIQKWEYLEDVGDS